jgi:pre-RNA processing PIH1/Nop17.
MIKVSFIVEGKICTIYDVVVNPAILEKSQDDATTRQLLIKYSFKGLIRIQASQIKVQRDFATTTSQGQKRPEN